MPSLAEAVEALLSHDESTTLDFKERQYPLTNEIEKGELLKDLLAFANAFRRETAYILLGVRETKGARATITGVTHHLNDADLQQLVNTKTNRTVEFSYHALALDGQQIGILRIPRQQRPTYLRTPYGKLQAQTVYLRHSSSTSIATLEEIARMGADNTARHQPELAALTSLQQHARFYQRIITLQHDISRLPHHAITHIARPPAYEDERRPLHVQYNKDYDTFRHAMSSARDVLSEQCAHATAADGVAITQLLTAMHEVEETVRTLGQCANSRLDLDLPQDKQRDAAAAADILSTLVARRLVTLSTA